MRTRLNAQYFFILKIYFILDTFQNNFEYHDFHVTKIFVSIETAWRRYLYFSTAPMKSKVEEKRQMTKSSSRRVPFLSGSIFIFFVKQAINHQTDNHVIRMSFFVWEMLKRNGSSLNNINQFQMNMKPPHRSVAKHFPFSHVLIRFFTRLKLSVSIFISQIIVHVSLNGWSYESHSS